MEREVQCLCSGCEDLVCLFRKCSFGGFGWLRGKSTIGLWREHTVGDPVKGSDILFHVHFCVVVVDSWVSMDVHRRSDMSPGAALAERRTACRTFRKSPDCWARNSSCRSLIVRYRFSR
jgi:hypothetical protein